MWRALFLKCMTLDHKLQRMLNDSKIAQLNSKRPLHQTAVGSVLLHSVLDSRVRFVTAVFSVKIC